MAQSVWMCAKIRVTYDIPKSSFLKQKQVLLLSFLPYKFVNLVKILFLLS
ncbi:hypothetical protein E1A91_D10G001600v1 [Gossypium mustelinum]|uniref:Uncharacterized protein n=1 Tax=Gossypium mustelinum TaxID=34275 RepID=A0A5D2T3W6_GOSMU|nr:hypothetical protein E1A91_D10G001600v1 [Gossypium mustelinum]